MLELRNIYKYYNPGTVNEMCLFRDFNLRVEEGEFVSVVGSNGSGKTSMLNLSETKILPEKKSTGEMSALDGYIKIRQSEPVRL